MEHGVVGVGYGRGLVVAFRDADGMACGQWPIHVRDLPSHHVDAFLAVGGDGPGEDGRQHAEHEDRRDGRGEHEAARPAIARRRFERQSVSPVLVDTDGRVAEVPVAGIVRGWLAE